MTDTEPCKRWETELAALHTVYRHVDPDYETRRKHDHAAWCRACGQWTWQPQEHLGRDPEESK